MSEFEQALRTLAPAASRMDRDRLMFLAGRASAKQTVGRSSTPSENGGDGGASPVGKADGVKLRPTARQRSRARWYWPAATGLSTCCAVVFGTLLIMSGSGPAVPNRQIAGPQPDPAKIAAAPDDGNEAEPGAVARADGESKPPSLASPQTPETSHSTGGVFAFAGADDPTRLPPYLQMRRLVLEQGVEALAPSPSSSRTGEALADVKPMRSQTLRALDRPGHTDTVSDELFDGAFPAAREGSL